MHSFAGVQYSNTGTTVWGMNAGCLIDIDAYAFEYGKHHPKKPVIGTGIIIDGIPQFIPMP